MFDLSPIITAKMTMATNDVAMQKMPMLIDNILPHRTCLKLGGKILINAPIIFFYFNTWGTNLGRVLC
jgi:hypothetical protein